MLASGHVHVHALIHKTVSLSKFVYQSNLCVAESVLGTCRANCFEAHWSTWTIKFETMVWRQKLIKWNHTLWLLWFNLFTAHPVLAVLVIPLCWLGGFYNWLRSSHQAVVLWVHTCDRPAHQSDFISSIAMLYHNVQVRNRWEKDRATFKRCIKSYIILHPKNVRSWKRIPVQRSSHAQFLRCLWRWIRTLRFKCLD